MKSLHRMEVSQGGAVVRHFEGSQLRAEIPAEHEAQYRAAFEGGELPATKTVAPVVDGSPDMNALIAAEVQKQVAEIVAAQLKKQGGKAKQ